MEDTWGTPADPHPLASEFAAQGAVTGHGSVPPEVALMKAQGWQLLECETGGAAAFAAVWEPSQRTWLPDRRIPTWEVHHGDGRVEQHEVTAAEIAEVARDLTDALARRSLPAPPRGRLWFVRVPAPWRALDDYVENLYARADAAGLHEMAGPAWPEFIREQIRSDFAAAAS
ncbi:DUF5956 family protein [Nocardioides massiliensis]|nr:DUF5956 family protein [Nocardioides massiliensis]